QRHVRRSTLDRVGWVDTPRPLTLFAALSILALVFMSARGLATGGSSRFVLWQCIGWLYLPIVYVLMRQALRGPGDAVLVGATVLGAGAFRAVEAIVLRLMFPSDDVMSYATEHPGGGLGADRLPSPGMGRPRVRKLGPGYSPSPPVTRWSEK